MKKEIISSYSIPQIDFFFERKYRLKFLISTLLLLPFLAISQNTAPPNKDAFLPSDSIKIAASTEYKNGQFYKIAYGNRYRKSWRTPVTFPKFDLNSTAGKLRIVKKGGGMSTKSLRLEGEDGREYVLRSVFKSGRRGVPDRFRNSVYEDVLQDLRVGGHPYSALPIAPLAAAADLYHTNPSIYYLPEQAALGKYKENAGELYLFEEYPNEGWNLGSFGNTEKIIGYDKLLEKVRDTPKNQVDEKWVVKSRLFDLWIGDYDRHDDQWRWAEFPDEANNIDYWRPIPRDRDQALFDINGVLPWILSRDFIHIQQHPFAGRIQDMKEFASNAKHFDRTWTTELEWKDWKVIAEELQAKLTDEVIENAFLTWPKAIYDLDAPSLIKRLKKRRNRMVSHAQQLYELLTKYVNVVGTDKREFFEVNRKNDNVLLVTVYALSKNGKKKKITYQRTFYAKETKEIRLYGLGGSDQYSLSGNAKNPIVIRVLGGPETDEIETTSDRKLDKKVVIYDTPKGVDLPTNVKFKKALTNDPKVNDYDRLEYKYDNYFPILSFGSTVDDGFFLGAGVTFTRYGFRKDPYKAKHRFYVQFSTQTDAFRFNYASDFTEQLIGGINFSPSINFDRPFIFNFYGLGNNTQILSDDERFHQIRLKRFSFEPMFKKRWAKAENRTKFGPFFENVIVERRVGRISDVEGFLRDTDRGNKSFLGFKVDHQFTTLDDQNFPKTGMRYKAKLTYYHNLDEEQAYARLEGSFSNFFHTDFPFPITLGSRIGGATLSDNNYYFFHNNNLGQNNYLRGFRNNRFAGTHIFYHNIDVRIPLFFFQNHLAPGEVGFLASFDYGKVWYQEDVSRNWKSSISGGIWWAPYRFTAINVFYTKTGNGEQNAFTLRTGFFF